MLSRSEIGVTLNTYSDILAELKRETAAQMDALLGNFSQARRGGGVGAPVSARLRARCLGQNLPG